jgi:hypothetical protein
MSSLASKKTLAFTWYISLKETVNEGHMTCASRYECLHIDRRIPPIHGKYLTFFKKTLPT